MSKNREQYIRWKNSMVGVFRDEFEQTYEGDNYQQRAEYLFDFIMNEISAHTTAEINQHIKEYYDMIDEKEYGTI